VDAAARTHEVDLLEQMVRVRRFEEKCVELYAAQKIRGFLHLYIGEEAAAVGTFAALDRDDAIVAAYREHGHALLRGMPAASVMSEMFGKASGCAGGRGGSMHLFSAERRFYGGYAIVGGGIPIAVGIALADRMRGLPRVTACLFGDGAVAEGDFHESLNLAALWKLPVLFLCENNRYAMGTALERHEAQTDLALKARGYGMPATTVDGMDVLAVERAVAEAAAGARRGEGPRFVEMQTYRFRAHSMYDPELYRDRAEVEAWKQRDPIDAYERSMREAGALEPGDRPRLEAAIDERLRAATAFADAGRWEPVEDLMRFVVSDRPRPRADAGATAPRGGQP
jgi:pyruvate dehydrogenase E1 component alpha subunit